MTQTQCLCGFALSQTLSQMCCFSSGQTVFPFVPFLTPNGFTMRSPFTPYHRGTLYQEAKRLICDWQQNAGTILIWVVVTHQNKYIRRNNFLWHHHFLILLQCGAPRLGQEAFRVFIPKMLTGLIINVQKEKTH